MGRPPKRTRGDRKAAVIYYFAKRKKMKIMLLPLGAAARGAVHMAGRTDGCRQQVSADNTPFLSKAQLSLKDAFFSMFL